MISVSKIKPGMWVAYSGRFGWFAISGPVRSCGKVFATTESRSLPKVRLSAIVAAYESEEKAKGALEKWAELAFEKGPELVAAERGWKVAEKAADAAREAWREASDRDHERKLALIQGVDISGK